MAGTVEPVDVNMDEYEVPGGAWYCGNAPDEEPAGLILYWLDGVLIDLVCAECGGYPDTECMGGFSEHDPHGNPTPPMITDVAL